MKHDQKTTELASLKRQLRNINAAISEAEYRGNYEQLDKLYEARYNLSTDVCYLEQELQELKDE